MERVQEEWLFSEYIFFKYWKHFNVPHHQKYKVKSIKIGRKKTIKKPSKRNEQWVLQPH